MNKELWNNRFAGNDFVYGKEANPFIKKITHIIPQHSVVGCFAEGEGRNAVHLAKQGHTVTAFDQSYVGLSKTKQLARENDVQVQTIECDLTKEKVEENRFDVAVMVFGHVLKQDQKFFFENIIQSVKEGGHIICEVYSDEQMNYQTGGPGTKERLYNPHDVLNYIKNEKCLRFYYGEAKRIEGKRHTGIGHVIQFVLMKK